MGHRPSRITAPRGRPLAGDSVVGHELRLTGDRLVRMLVQFLNYPRPSRPWSELFGPAPHGYVFEGEAFSDSLADDYQQLLTQCVTDWQAGRYGSFAVPLRLSFSVHRGKLSVFLDDTKDLATRYFGALFELARTNRLDALRPCEHCGRYFVADTWKAKFCPAPSPCSRLARTERRRQQNREANKRWRGKTTQASARRGR